jgi:hypothetical protein
MEIITVAVRVRSGRPLTVSSSSAWLFAAALLCAIAARPAQAQSSDGIFQRFNSGREVAKTWQTLVEFPVLAEPQTTPNARIVANEGVNYVVAFRPENRIYGSNSYGYARLEWAPKNEVKTAQVVTLDFTEILNFRVARAFIMSFGVGLGVMHGVTVERGGRFQARFEPFLPIQFGLAVPIGRSVLVEAKVIQSSFFGPGPVISVTRGLIGFGYNY